MKKTIFSFTLLLLAAFGEISLMHAQDKPSRWVTVEFTVNGACGACERRIEKAALIPGVRSADWDKFTRQIKVIYSPRHTTEETIHKAIAEAGHDTEREKAPDAVYKSLPTCCAYRDGVETH